MQEKVRGMKHRRYSETWPTPDEAEAVRADRSGIALEVGIIAACLLLAFMVAPAAAWVLRAMQ